MASKFTITAELNLQTKNLNQVVNNLRQQFQGANLNINIKDLAQAQSQINKISSSAQNAQKSVGLLGSSFSQAFKKFTIVTAVTGTIVGFTRAVKNAVGDAIEFEREVVKIAQATGKTTSQLKGLTSEISSVSSSFGVSSKELILAARSLTQAGFAADKVTGALKILAQTELAATFDSIQDTTEGAIALLNQFGKQAQRTGSEVAFLEKSFSAINQVSKEFAVESSDLVTAVRTTGSAFESAGGSLDELLALFTSVRATTRESAESIATGFRTIFTRVQRVDTINNLKALGIELQDAEGKFIGPIEATKKLSAALNSIDPRDFRFNLVVEELGGFRQVSKVIPLIQQFAVTQKALNVAQGSSGSLAKDAQTAQQSLAVQIAKTREEFSRFIRDLTGTDSFQSTVRFLLDLASAFVRVADSIKPLVPLIAGFATLKAGTAVKGAFDQLAGPRRKAQGGKIHAFASGGMVPGSGNGDTVPAMLTPGEFVIRKSSVKKLGAENLARANKYAGGGPIQYYEKGSEDGVQKNDISKQYAEDVSSFSINSAARAGSFKEGLQERQKSASKMREKKREYGGAFLRPVGEDTEYTGYVTKAEVLKKAKIKTASSKAKNLEQAKYPFTIKLASVNKNTKEIFQSSILDGIANVVDQTSRKVFASSVSTGAVPKDISYKTLKRSNIDQTVGNIFEASIKSLSGKFTNDDKVGAGNQTFDFPDGLGDASKYFDPELSNVKTDAKATYNLQSLQSLVEKVKADIKEEYIPTTKKEIQKVEKNPQNVINRTTATQEQANQDAFKNKIWEEFSKNRNVNLIKAKDNVANFAIGKNSKFTSEFSRIFNLAKSKFNDEASIINFLNENTQPFTPKAKALGGLIHFANGGAASGTDTVPAMLTPGEYVINKKSAQAIGYGNLNRMNKVGKFANGGQVQYLSRGGEAGTKGIPNAPLVDDILQATGAILPNPKNAIAKIKEAGGASLDMDRTLLRTIGDLAYGKAKTPEEKLAVLKKYFFDDAARLKDVKSAKITQFGIALQDAVKNKEIDPKTLSVISKSDRTPGLPEFLQKLFGISPANMVFTGGKNKQPAVDMFRERGAFLASGGAVQKFAKGGEVQHLNIGGIAKDTNSEFSDIFSKYSDNDLNHAFIKTALLSPNFADSLTKYRELNLLSKSDNSKGNSLKTMMSAYGLSKLNDKQLNDKYKNKFEITDDIKNTFKYYDRGITDLVSTFKKEDKNKISEIANIDLKKDKNYGDIEVFTGKNAISAKYAGDENDRTGFITAVKKGDFYRTKLSYATSGYGLKLYETLLNEVTKAGSWLAPDNTISSAATNLWKGYYSRSDVDKKLLDYSDWNNKTGKFKTTPAKDIERLKSTWPSKKDLDWALQHSYRKTSLDADDKNIIRVKKKPDPSYEGKEAVKSAFTRFAFGGNVPGEGNQDTVPAMLTPGEYVINKKSAQAIGYGALNRMNKVSKFANGGPVQMFNDGTTGQGVDQYSAFRPKASSSSPTIDVLSSSLEQSLTKLNESSTKVTNKFGDINDQLLLFGPVIAGAISQMGMFNKATADIISATTFTFSTIQGIGGNLIDLGAGIKGIKPELLKGLLKGFGAGLTGFASAQAVAAARVTYLGQTAEESGKKFNSFVEALSKGQGTTQGQLAEALTKQFQAASDAQGRSSGAAKAAGGATALIAGGVAAAFPVTAAFAPVIAAAAAPIMEEFLYQIGAFSESSDKAKTQADALAAAMFSATTSNRDFQKFFQNIEKQTPQDVTKQAQSLANAYKDQQSQIAKLGDVAKASDAVKQQFQAVSEAAKLTATNLQTVIGIQLQNAVKKSSDLLNRGFVPDTNKLLKPIFDAIESDVTARYATQINEAGGETTQKGMSLVNIRNKEMAIEQERARKSLNEATKQQLQMIAVLNLENNIRKDLVGSLQKQSAISASIERLSYELDLASKSVSNIDAAFSGSITGLKSSFDTDILKLKSPDQGKLDKALDPVRAIGPIGRDLADNLLNINQVMPTLEAKLIQFSNATDTASGALFDVKKFVEESFNIKADSIVGRTLVKIIEGTTTGTGGEKAVTAAKTSLRQEDVRKKIVESFQKFGEEFRTQAGGILDNLARAEQEGRAVAEKINESRQKQLDLQLQSVDTFSNYIDALARARGRDLSLIEKNTIRTMKQYTLAGNMANNVGAISTELSGIYKKLNEGGLDLDTQKNLSFTATKLKAALEDLANQSGKTSDILAEIEKQRAKRESARDFGKEFTFGSNEQRQSIANSIQGLQRVLTTGNINDVPEELRSGVSSLLDRFKDVPVFNGRTGRQVENKLIANQFRAMGGGAFANMIEADTSTPEQILIGELQRTFAVQIYAQQALSKMEQQKQELLQTALNEYTTAIGSYTVKLEALVQEFQTKAEEKAIPVTRDPLLDFGITDNGMMNEQGQLIFPQAVPQDAKAKIDLENIQAINQATGSLAKNIEDSDAKISNLTLSLETLRGNFNKLNDSGFFKNLELERKLIENQARGFGTDVNATGAQAAAAGMLSSGGLIYRANGGSIFQPKGTDTVPAMLTPGEFVIKKSSVDKIGADNLSALNNGYASGGLVSYLAGGGGASGTNAINDLVKKVAKLEERIKKVEDENKILKGKLGQVGQVNQIAGGVQNMQQMMGAMVAPQMGIGMGMAGMAAPMTGMGSRNKARERARQRKTFSEEGFGAEPPKKKQDFPTSTMASDAMLDPFGVNQTELSLATVTPVELKTKAQTKEEERAALAKRLIEEARAADKARNEERANALLNPVGPPAPKGMRPAGSIYTQEQWAQQQEKGSKEKELSDLRVARMKQEMVLGAQTKTDQGYRQSTPEEVMAKYGERPSNISEEQWISQIRKAQDQGSTDFFQGVKKSGLKSKYTDYGSAAGSVYTEKTQEALDKTKAIIQQADDLTAKRSGKAVGTNYKSPQDVPVLTAEQVGAPVTMKDIAGMQQKAKAPAIVGSNLTPAEQVANNVAANQPNQYEGKNALSDYLNAQGQMLGNQAVANRVAESQSWQGIARAGSFNRESKAMIENTPQINTDLPDLNYLSSAPSDIGASPLDIFKKKKLPGFAKGGSTDTVPAMLTPGEFVMNKDSVSKYGKSFMEKMNKGGVVPGFASGGYVGYYAGGGIAATIANRKARGMYDGQMATNAQAMQGSMAMRQNMMSNQFANNPAVQQGVMANPMANAQQKPATGNAANAGGGMTDAAQQFSQFVTQFSDAAKMMTGMTMTHKVTVDGQLNIGGINGEAVANQIRDAIGTYVAKLVEDKMGKKMEGPI